MLQRKSVLLLHLSFVVMIIGGMLTWLTHTKGMVKIAPGATVEIFIDENGNQHELPVPIALDKFEVEYYPGGVVPRDYVSHLIVDGKKEVVSMNNILEIKGYRLLQASYDSEGNTVLSVNHDPYGIFTVYAGYLLFAISGLWILLKPGGRFHRLLKEVTAVIAVLVAFSGNVNASKIDGVPRAAADSLKGNQVIYNGKVITFNTLAHDVLLKVYGRDTYRGLTPEQTLMSLKLFPTQWKDQPIIKIKEKALTEALGIDGKYAALSDLFDENGNYRVSALYLTLGQQHQRAVEDLDEKVGILLTLYNGQLIEPRPDDVPPLSDARVKAELLYNSLPFTKIIFMLLFTGFFFGMAALILGRDVPSARGMDKKTCQRRILAIVGRLPLAILWIAFVISLVCFAFQWYLSGRIPLGNTYETLQFVVLMLELILILAARKNRLLLTLGLLASGALALVAHLVASNPVVTPLMPVLHSGWLSLHVSLVMMSYAILAFTFVIAIVGLSVPSMADKMRRLSLCMLYPGVYLLGLGIITGSVWANVSWGQYWSWDPKETWALITMLIYAVPLHASIRFLRRPKPFHIYMLFAILSMAMTYFGVNYLNSLHAYN